MGETAGQPVRREPQPLEETRIFITLGSFTYPFVVIVYSALRAVVMGQDLISFPPDNCVGADCKIKGADYFGFYLAVCLLLPSLISLPTRILVPLGRILKIQGTLFDGLWQGVRKALELVGLVWIVFLSFGGAAILSVELVARRLIPGVLNWFGYALGALGVVYWVWVFRSLAQSRSR